MDTDSLLAHVQRQTLGYFTDFAHPDSGMIRERSNNSTAYGKDVVATGATGFGIMSIIAGQSNGWITHDDALKQISKMVGFLEKCDHFHGVFPHFMDGSTGKTIPFSKYDDGADLVETSFLMMGLLTARQHFSTDNKDEAELRERINKLWERVDWKWHERENPQTHKKELMWHWSPNNEWKMNLPIKGWNEALVTYVLAAASPTHPIDKETYEQCWRDSPEFKTGQLHDGIALPLGEKKGGPLFISQYSFMGISPEGLTDADKHDYWLQNRNHTLINRAHCVKNPGGHKGYGAHCWGLTSSDEKGGYAVHSPTDDNGTIAPTAAISAMPYTPAESTAVLEYLYHKRGSESFGKYGFYDAFNDNEAWQSKNYIGIDQAPMVVMIENHKSGLLWKLFMSCPETQKGLRTLGFDSPYLHHQPTELITMQRKAQNGADFLDRLCGSNGYKPLSDSQLSAVLGLPKGSQWQIKEIRAGKQVLTQEQSRKLLLYCGFSDSSPISHASNLLTTPSSSFAQIK